MLVHRDLGDESVTSSSDERYACPACDIQFPGKYVLAAHVTDEHQIKPSRPNKCKVCYKVFAEPSRLQVRINYRVGYYQALVFREACMLFKYRREIYKLMTHALV